MWRLCRTAADYAFSEHGGRIFSEVWAKRAHFLVIDPHRSLVAVDGGHRAVIWHRFSGGIQDKVVGEGTHFRIPLVTYPTTFDVRRTLQRVSLCWRSRLCNPGVSRRKHLINCIRRLRRRTGSYQPCCVYMHQPLAHHARPCWYSHTNRRSVCDLAVPIACRSTRRA